MAYVILAPNSNAPAESYDPSFGQRVGNAIKAPLMDMGLGYAEPYITGYKTWFGSDEPVRLPVSKPYEGWVSPASAAKLKICGVDLPDGIVMTHCQVGSTVSYSPTPLQEEIRRKSRIEARTYTDKDGKKIGTLFSIKSEKGPGAEKIESLKGDLADGKSALRRAITKMATDPKSKGGTEESLGETQDLANTLAAERLKELDAIAVQESTRRARQRLKKVHVGETRPRTLELRFTLTEVISGSRILLASRFERLDRLHRLFCQNPTLKDDKSVATDNSWLTEASKVTAQATGGRMVRLSSAGIDPYGVDIWVTTKFVHQEVPDSDLIFVRVVLSEYESIFKDELPPPEPLAQVASKPVPPVPAAPPKPSYSPTGGWATPADWAAP